MMTTNPNVNPRKFREFIAKMTRRVNRQRATVYIKFLDRKTDEFLSYEYAGIVEMGYDDYSVWIKCGNNIPVYIASISKITDYKHSGNLFTICDLHETVNVRIKTRI